MKRDLDLIRLLLMEVEGEDEVDLSEYTKDQILYHKDQLIQAELVIGTILTGGSRNIPWDVEISGMTPEGHDFLGNARDSKTWKKVLKTVQTTTGTVSMKIFIEILKMEVKQRFGIGQ